ncbi:MAG: prephenate dehydrogenase/arogenate dehydrogenase family protein, partial [Leptospirales bacterium]
ADEVLVCPEESQIADLELSAYDLIVLGTPVKSVQRLAALIPGDYAGIVTDMSSTRREVQAAFAARPDLRFVGSHPMCGSENRGPSAARPDLFLNRLCILTPLERGDEALTARVRDLWALLGMQTFVLSGPHHDEVLSYLSHGPHLLAGLLTLWARNESVNSAIAGAPMPITGGGFKDMARIAGSNPEMWTDILVSNRDFLAAGLKDFQRQLGDLIQKVESGEAGDWLEWFDRARAARNLLCGYPSETDQRES